MRMLAYSALVLGLTISTLCGQETAPRITPLGAKPVADAASYGLGYDFGVNLSGAGLKAEDLKQADLVAGIVDAISGKEPSLQPQLVQAAMEALFKKVGERKKDQAKAFLEENKKKEGVQSTPEGLQYQVIKSGNGAMPTAQNSVSVHYEGKLISGEIFDSSIQRGQPASFGVTQVIPGWTQALLRMKVGDKWKLFIPPELAYGERGSPPAIGPNETLIFEVELLEVR